MGNNFKIRIKSKDFEIEVESSEKEFVEKKIKEYFVFDSGIKQKFNKESKFKTSSDSKKPLSLNEFVKQINPNSGTENVLAVGYYCEKYENLEKLKTNDIVRRFKKIKYSHKNPRVAISEALRQSFLMEANSSGDFVLSRTGEAWVEERIQANAKES